MLAVSVFLPVQVWAVPDAGSLRRDLAPPPASRVPSAIFNEEALPVAQPGEIVVKLDRFDIRGATLIPVAEIQGQLADLIGMPLTLPQIEVAKQRISDLYRNRGWYVRVWFPEQTISDNVVIIELLEGKLGAVRVEGGKNSSDLAFTGRVLTRRLQIGEALSVKALERGLLLSNDLPGVSVKGALEPGANPGETALNVQVKPMPLLSGGVTYDNTGYRTSGINHFSGGVNVMPGNGHLIQMQVQGNASIAMLDLKFSTALGDDGARVGLSTSHMRYALSGKLKPLELEGTAETYGATILYPWLRSVDGNLYFSGSLNQNRFEDEMLGQTIRRRRINALDLAVDGDRADRWLGGGLSVAGLKLTLGDLDMGGIASDIALDRQTVRASGGFVRLGGKVSRQQQLSEKTVLFAGLNGQVGNKNLSSSARMSLGGPTGVRAYPVGEAAGDDVAIFTAELRRELASGFHGAAFFDSGWVRVNHDRYDSFTGPNSYALQGAGLNLNRQWPGSADLDVTFAVPIGSNDGSQNGRNQDGSARESRFWVNFSKYFG